MRVISFKSVSKLALCAIFIFMVIIVLEFNSNHVKNHLKHYIAIKETLFDDEAPILSKETQFEKVRKVAPNLPIEFWLSNKQNSLKLNETCAKFPNLYNLEYRNTNWQNLLTKNASYELYGAYLDTRPQNYTKPIVRILGMANQIEPIEPTYCQIWFANSTQPKVVPTLPYDLIWYKDWGNYETGIYQPYLISCEIPEQYRYWPVAAVSLVENYCDNATNLLKVIYDNPNHKDDFAVCVKGLDFLYEDISAILVEWIEVVFLMGVHKIYFYNLQVHENVSKVLDYYEKLGKIEVIPLTLPAGQPNIPFLQHLYLEEMVWNKFEAEVIPYNDCFYKHMYQYRYISLLDIDEVIVPLNLTSWKELIDQTNIPDVTSYLFSNVYFYTDMAHKHNWFDDIPNYMHMLQHVYRDKEVVGLGYNGKSFYNTESVLTLHNHNPIACVDRPCYPFGINETKALLFHYKRKSEEEYKEASKDAIKDITIWRYKETLMDRVTSVLRKLRFLHTVKNDDNS